MLNTWPSHDLSDLRSLIKICVNMLINSVNSSIMIKYVYLVCRKCHIMQRYSVHIKWARLSVHWVLWMLNEFFYQTRILCLNSKVTVDFLLKFLTSKSYKWSSVYSSYSITLKNNIDKTQTLLNVTVFTLIFFGFLSKTFITLVGEKVESQD